MQSLPELEKLRLSSWTCLLPLFLSPECHLRSLRNTASDPPESVETHLAAALKIAGADAALWNTDSDAEAVGAVGGGGPDGVAGRAGRLVHFMRSTGKCPGCDNSPARKPRLSASKISVSPFYLVLYRSDPTYIKGGTLFLLLLRICSHYNVDKLTRMSRQKQLWKKRRLSAASSWLTVSDRAGCLHRLVSVVARRAVRWSATGGGLAVRSASGPASATSS